MSKERLNRIDARQTSDNACGERRVAIKRDEKRRARRVKTRVFNIVQTTLISSAVFGGLTLLTNERDSIVETNSVETGEPQSSSLFADLLRSSESFKWQNADFFTEREPAPLPTRELATVVEIPLAIGYAEQETPKVEEPVDAAPLTSDEVEEEEEPAAPFITGSVSREQFFADRDAFSPQPVQAVCYDEDGRKATGRISRSVAEAIRGSVNSNGSYAAL